MRLTEDSLPWNSTPMNLCARNRLENRKEGDQSGPRYVRQARLDRLDAYTVRSLLHSVDPSAWS